MYNVTITSRAEKDLRRLERTTKNRLVTAILALGNDPRPAGCKKIQSEIGLWRIRVGHYRIGYTIDDAAQEIVIIRVANRNDFYG